MGLLNQQQQMQNQLANGGLQGGGANGDQTAMPMLNGQQPDNRVEHLIKMFQSQLFKKSFITTSLLIIQRRMSDKYFVRYRSQNARDTNHGQRGDSSGAQMQQKRVPKEPMKKKEVRKEPLTTLESLGNQI